MLRLGVGEGTRRSEAATMEVREGSCKGAREEGKEWRTSGQ